MLNSNFGIFYRLLVLSTIIFIFGCQATPDKDNNVIKPPEWISQKEFKEYPKDDYFVSVGVSDSNFEEARSRAFVEIAKMISESFRDIMFPWGDEEIVKNFDKYSSLEEYKKYVEKNELRHVNFYNRNNDLYNALFGILLKHTKQDFRNSHSLDKSILPSWVELNTVEQKRYTSGFVYFVLITFNIKESFNFIDFETIRKKNKGLQPESSNAEDFYKTLEDLFSRIEHTQQAYFKGISELSKKNNELTSKKKNDKVMEALAGLKSFETLLVEIYRDFEIKFSADNIKGWRDKFTDKIYIQIFWKKKLIKIPLRFETSTDAQVELFKSAKDDVSYEMRVMPLSASNRTNTSGQHFIEFDLKPDGLRFSKFINFALKKKFHFTLPTKKNSYFQVVVNPEILDKASATKQAFAENLCESMKNNLVSWCENNKYQLNTSAQIPQTQEGQNRYDFKVQIDFERVNIIESKEIKVLQTEVNLKLMYFNDSLAKPRWVRLKHDTFKYSNDIQLTDSVNNTTLFDLYCAGMVLNPDFQKVLASLFEKAVR